MFSKPSRSQPRAQIGCIISVRVNPKIRAVCDSQYVRITIGFDTYNYVLSGNLTQLKNIKSAVDDVVSVAFEVTIHFCHPLLQQLSLLTSTPAVV